ncbi:calmodulin-like protein [Blastocystis sp. subtype 4]|uniref:calmodulin-like protein n=1 Tax=Blastocystis sp. subtype 4 TaxID=944170 RepID=UPI000711C556|nr:calmodulin-like protein [Blastocystis sp. subtype 4]KNB41806.1 calmodulin-like protein [Blastocystis sp. subtype 4]|eukprot:XP_014525249.1 calmodulin-like protein [Blastocystis sp. subtype 4]
MELFRQVFNYLDKTRCGIIYPEYFSELLRISGFNPTQAEIKKLQDKYSQQRGLTFDDFILLISNMDCVVTEEDIRKSFKIFDKFNDGKIRIDLLRSVLSKVGEPLSEKELDNFLTMMNLKDKDYIEYDELCSAIASYDM